MATPNVRIIPATLAHSRQRKDDHGDGKDFPINDRVDVVESDGTFSVSLNNCHTTNSEISGTAGVTGAVVWSPTTKITAVLTTVTSPPLRRRFQLSRHAFLGE